MSRKRWPGSDPMGSMSAAASRSKKERKILKSSNDLSTRRKRRKKVITLPNKKGRFGPYGGRYVPETLMPALLDMEEAYLSIRRDAAFKKELSEGLKSYVGRPTPLYFAARLSERFGGAKVYLKREDLCHTGAHKINNTLGQILLARK